VVNKKIRIPKEKDPNDKSGYGINEIADNMSKELNLNS